MDVKGIFVSTTLKPNQGATDFGYYIDSDRNPSSGDEVERLVENDEAYMVEAFQILDSGVHIRLKSENRKAVAEIEEEAGIKKRGLNKTIYQKTGDPALPHHYEEPEDRNRKLTALAEYALEHGRGHGIKVEDVDWEDIMDEENLSKR